MGLEIRLLGELTVVRDGQLVALPASKKTRALLAHLAVTGRPQLREKLCTLLWDGPDDPRAALRWSLTKLRPVVDDKSATRLVADRDRVELVANGATIDLDVIRKAIPGGSAAGVARAPLESMRSIAPLVRGDLLEGLELPDCYRYDEWCRAERESTRRLCTAVLASLVERLPASEAQEALSHARTWLQLDAIDEAAHVAVIRLLTELDRKAEALAQYTSCERLFARELNRRPSRELERVRMAITMTAVEVAPAPIEVTAASTPIKIVDAAATPLVGRAQERAAIKSLVDSPQGQLLLLLGDPGIGKTRLLDEVNAISAARGLEVFRGRGVEAEQIRPYGAWLDALADAGDHPFRATTTEADRARLFDAIAEWLVARAGTRGLCLIIDDVQWIDEGSAALLHFLARNPGLGTLLRIACGARPGELADNQAALRVVRGLTRERRIRQIGLSPLDAAETVALATACTPGVDGARVFAESGGHPLFAVEIARALARGETEWSSLDALIAERLDLIEGTARELMPWAAALGSAFSADVLAAVSSVPLTLLARGVADLERHAIVRASGSEWDFVHDLVRAAAYQSVSEPRRRLLHLQIARTLAALPDSDGERAGEIAHHADLGDDSRLCASSCLAAATRAMRMFAPEEAAALADRGLGHAGRLTSAERAKLQIALLVIALHADVAGKRRDTIGAAFERVLADARAAGLDAEAARAANELSWIPYRAGDFALARTLSLEAARSARDAAPDAKARALAYSSHCLAMIGREMNEAQRLAYEALEILGDNADIPTLPFALGLIREHQGDFPAAISLLERSILLNEREGVWWQFAHALTTAAMLELTRGRAREALAYCDTVRANAGRLADSAQIPFARVISALALLTLGQPCELDAALEGLRLADAPVMLASALTYLGELELSRGDLTAAARHAAGAIAEGMRGQRISDLVVARCLAARIAEIEGRNDEVVAQRAALDAIDREQQLSTRALEALEAVPRG